MTRSLLFQAVLLTTVGFGALCAGGGIAQAQFKQTDLASDVPHLATITDPNLKNTWGLTAIPGGSSFWIDNEGTSTSSLYSVTGSTTITPANPMAPRYELRGHSGRRTYRRRRKFGDLVRHSRRTRPFHFR